MSKEPIPPEFITEKHGEGGFITPYRCDSCGKIEPLNDMNTIDIDECGEHTTKEICDECFSSDDPTTDSSCSPGFSPSDAKQSDEPTRKEGLPGEQQDSKKCSECDGSGGEAYMGSDGPEFGPCPKCEGSGERQDQI